MTEAIIRLLAIGLLLGGLWSLSGMIQAWSEGSVRLNSGLLGPILAWGLLRKRPWAHPLALLGFMWTLVTVPAWALLAFSGKVAVRYDMPPPFAGLVGPPAIALVMATTMLPALVGYAALTSDAGRSMFGLWPYLETRRRRPAAILGLATAISLATVWLATQPSYHLELVSALGGAMTDLSISGSRAYVMVGGRMMVFDLSDPDSPRPLGGLSETLNIWRGYRGGTAIAADGDQAFVVRRDVQELWVVRATDAEQPQVERKITFPMLPSMVAVSPDGVFVLGNSEDDMVESMLMALGKDAAGPPEGDATWRLPGRPRALGVGSGLVLALTDPEFVSAEYPDNSGTILSIVNATSLVTGEPLSTLALPESSAALVHQGPHGYVLTWEGRLLTIDLRDPAQPKIVHTLALRPSGLWIDQCLVRLVASRDHLIVSDRCDSRLLTVDLSVPDRPRLSGGTNALVASRMAVGPERIYAIEEDQSGETQPGQRSFIDLANPESTMRPGDLSVLDMADPDRPRVSGSWEPLIPQRIVPIEQRAYVVQPQRPLRLLDIANPERPLDRGDIGPPMVVDAAAANGRLYIITLGGRFGVMEASGALADSIVMPERTDGGEGWTIQGIYDGVAYIARPRGGELLLVDVGKPGRPLLLGSASIPGSVLAVAARDRKAYVAIQPPPDNGMAHLTGSRVNQVVVLDVTDPEAASVVGTIQGWESLGPLADLIVDGRQLIVGGWAGGVRAYKVRRATRPSPTPSWSGSAGWSLALTQEGLLVGGQSNLTLLYAGPFRRGAQADELSGFVSPRIAAAGSFVYLADGLNGLAVVALRRGPASEEEP